MAVDLPASDLAVGSRRFRVEVTSGAGGWTARARCLESGDLFGPPLTAASAEAASARLSRWLQWQHDHAHAMQLLQEAERAYHRLVADRAFAALPDDTVTQSARRAALNDVETARRFLDAIRATRPE